MPKRWTRSNRKHRCNRSLWHPRRWIHIHWQLQLNYEKSALYQCNKSKQTHRLATVVRVDEEVVLKYSLNLLADPLRAAEAAARATVQE